VFTGCGGANPGQILDKKVSAFPGPEDGDGAPFSLANQFAFIGNGLRRIRPNLEGRRRGPRSRAEIDRERRERLERTCQEVDEIYADYLSKLPPERPATIGVVYARFSTRFQDSIADQVRTNLEHALDLNIFVPREFVFFDMAVRGIKKQRDGLAQAETVLKAKHAQVLLLFSTSRLFRKTYRTLEFVDRIHKGLGIRCIFVKSGIDTNDKQRWEMTLAAMSMIDQFVVSMNVANIQAAHEGLLGKQLIFGTLSFGYSGEPLDGQTTRLGKPRCRITIDVVTGPIVRQIFAWYVGYWDDGRVGEKLSINQIIQRLNSDLSIPLPPRAVSGEWTRLAVRRILMNSRYCALWKYGVTESVYLPDLDYTLQRVRVAPLKEIVLEDLRLISDQTWQDAQTRLATDKHNGGRRSKDGDRKSRPKLLNGLLVCPVHNRPLYVGGAFGRSMYCPSCARQPCEQRPLFSSLPRALAARLICTKLAELIEADSQLVADALAACNREVEAEQQPDPALIARLNVDIAKLDRQIEFTRRTVGETDDEQAEAERLVKRLQTERAKPVAQLRAFATARRRRTPTEAEARELTDKLKTILTTAALGDDEADVGSAREIIELLTGGRIELYQMGERKAQRGWLQGRFTVRLLPYLVEALTGAPATAADDGVEIVIDFKECDSLVAQSEKAWQFYKQGWIQKRIQRELGCGRSKLLRLLKAAAERHGETLEDGRVRRKRLPAKQVDPVLYDLIVDDVMRRWHNEELIQDIAKAKSVNLNTITAVVRKWHELNGIPFVDGRTRRAATEKKTGRPPSRPGGASDQSAA
jgi:site-specific DNA recombinase